MKDNKPEIHILGELKVRSGPTPEAPRVIATPPITGRNVRLSLEHFDQFKGEAEFSVRLHFGASPRFTRGIVKIAFSSLAFFSSPAATLKGQFDPVREFVRHGVGHRRIVMSPAPDKKYQHIPHPGFVTNDGHVWSYLRLGLVEFFVDLSPEMMVHDRLVAELRRLRPGQYAELPPAGTNFRA